MNIKSILSRLPLLTLLTVAACAVGPDYERPQTDVPKAYKEIGQWTPAQPNDGIDRGAWWRIYNDPQLDALETQIDISNQNLKAAEAAWRAARATIDQVSASLFPTLGVNGGAVRQGNANHNANNSLTANANASWDIDLWGGIRRNVESSEDTAEATFADLASARLSAQSDLATAYFNLRMEDELRRALNAAVCADQQALKIVQNRYNVGNNAKADVLASQTQLETAQSAAIASDLRRAQYEHAVAVLIGKTPADFTIAPLPTYKTAVPLIPVAMPSVLLERRPDVAAAERRMASANAQIGVQTAAWYPNVSITASYGFSAQVLSKLFQASNSLWSFGPAIAETIFDGGARAAAVDVANANYDQTVATYRQTTLTAFQDVEDELTALNTLTKQEAVEQAALKSAREALALTTNQYKEGIISYSDVVTAQITALSHEQSALSVTQNKLAASVSLIRALGGGWDGAKTGN